MAAEVNEATEAALNTISSTAERSGNMKKELKNTIFENVSTLRKLFVKLIHISESRNRKINELEKLANTKNEHARIASSIPVEEHCAPSSIYRGELARTVDRQVATQGVEQAKLYSEVLGG